MNTPKTPTTFDSEPDADGIPRYRLMRDSSGRRWHERIPERVRRELRICIFMDQIEANLEEGYKALAAEGIRLIEHGDSQDNAVLLKQWQEAATTFQREVERIAGPTKRLVAALKELFQL